VEADDETDTLRRWIFQSGTVDSNDATWTISDRGNGDPKPKDSQAVVVVVRV
jgi:hypothetical protein